MSRTQSLECGKRLETERIDCVVSTAVKDVTLGSSQREDVLVWFFLVQWLLRLAQVVDQQGTRSWRTLARGEQQVSTWDQLERFDLFFKALEFAYSSQADDIPHHNHPLCSCQQKVSLIPECDGFYEPDVLGEVANVLHGFDIPYL